MKVSVKLRKDDSCWDPFDLIFYREEPHSQPEISEGDIEEEKWKES
jgi:hypothetical protein